MSGLPCAEGLIVLKQDVPMILIAFGANLDSVLGSPSKTYTALPSLLAERGVFVEEASSLFRTKPVPASDQPDFLNAVIRVRTALSPQNLMSVLHDLEADLGRKRTVAYAPRGIDLDLIAHNDTVVTSPALCLPHPRMQSRAFVLDPLCEIAPYWTHPVLGLTAKDLTAALER